MNLVLGVPTQERFQALLRQTAGGGRVPTWPPSEPYDHHTRPRWYDPECRHTHGRYGCLGPTCRYGDTLRTSLVLQHPDDPEAGAMGLSRLAWVAAPLVRQAARRWRADDSGAWRVHLGEASWSYKDIPALLNATGRAHAIGLVGVWLGLFDRVETL